MDTGLRLKYHRLKKKISLEEVASGIISPRELKKIESGLKEPSLQDLEPLCKKLEISLAPKDNPVGQVLVKNFKTSLLHPQNKGKIMEQYADINEHPLLFVNEEVELEYSVQQIRYFIITGDLDSAEEKLKEMERFKEFMNQEQFYLFHKYKGNYHYLLGDHETALKIYLLAEKISPGSIAYSEVGDLYYSIGITAAQCWDTEMAYKYTDLALKIYQKEFIPKRIVECHSNIALTQYQFGNFKAAADHYRDAYKIGSKLENDILRFTTEYNYGYSHFLLQNYEPAIEHIENSLNFIPPEYIADTLLSYCVLIKSNIEIDNRETAKNWVSKGLKIIQLNRLNIDSPTNHAFKEAYLEFMCLVHFIQGNVEEYEQLVLDKLIPSLQVNNNYYEIGYFYGHLGNIYFELEKYDKAAIALNNARLAYRNLVTNKKE